MSDLVTYLNTSITNFSNNKLSAETLDVSTCQNLHIQYNFCSFISPIRHERPHTEIKRVSTWSISISTLQNLIVADWTTRSCPWMIWFARSPRSSCLFDLLSITVTRRLYDVGGDFILLRIDRFWVSSSFCSRDASFHVEREISFSKLVSQLSRLMILLQIFRYFPTAIT